ncbi:MAG: antitoxin [Armatimonadetes bacterium]|nr:antitoxin [Armatimonadota bacterium]
MRTTVTLDPDVAEKLHAYAHRHGLSFKKALNELLRRGLHSQQSPAERRRFQVDPHRGGFRPGIDAARLNQLIDELEVSDFIREAREAP